MNHEDLQALSRVQNLITTNYEKVIEEKNNEIDKLVKEVNSLVVAKDLILRREDDLIAKLTSTHTLNTDLINNLNREKELSTKLLKEIDEKQKKIDYLRSQFPSNHPDYDEGIPF